MLRSPFVLLFFALLLSLVASWWFNPLRQAMESGNPAAELAGMARTGTLGPALAAADRGELQSLIRWVNQAPALERQRLALLLVSIAENELPKLADGSRKEDSRVVWKHRRRLMAFADLPSGNPALDLVLDNLLAYSLACGSGNPAEPPPASDLALARVLAKRLEKAAKERKDHALWDTIGCVRYQSGDRAMAVEAFAEAVRLAEVGKKAEQLPLYRRRLDAAKIAAPAGSIAPPLPPDWE